MCSNGQKEARSLRIVHCESGAEYKPWSIRVLMADDNPAFLAAMSSLLRLYPHLDVVGRVVSGNDTLLQAVRLRPDVLLIDPFSPDATLWDVIRRVKLQVPDMRIVVLSERGDGPFRDLVRSIGADAFLLKDEISEQLVPAIEDLMAEFSMGTEKRFM